MPRLRPPYKHTVATVPMRLRYVMVAYMKSIMVGLMAMDSSYISITQVCLRTAT